MAVEEGYDIGDVVRVTASFTNIAGAAADPTFVEFKCVNPATGVVTPYTFGVDVQLVKDSVGHYHVDINATHSGAWKYRFQGTGSNQAALEGAFQVKRSYFE